MIKKRIVIVGGGFAGVRAALDLSHHIYKDAEIILIDQNGRHQYHPDFYRIATTFFTENKKFTRADFQTLFNEASISLTSIIPENKVRLLNEQVVDIDAEKNTVQFVSGAAIGYDWLILAVGSVSSYFAIQGVKEFVYPLKSAHDALTIRNEVDEVFTRKAKKDLIHILIGGGGFTGCELGAALASYTNQLSRVHSHPEGNIKITIVEAGDVLLPSASSWAQEKAKKRLQSLGVDVVFGSPIERATSDEIHIKNKKISLPYDIFIWTAGVRAHPLAEKITGAKQATRSCLIVDDYLRVEPYENIFATGDISFCRENETSDPLPMTAQVAISQGRYVAYTLKRLIHKKKLFRYHFHTSYFVIPLGGHYALADLGWIRFSGYVGWILRRLIDLNYYTTILPWRKALKRWRCKL